MASVYKASWNQAGGQSDSCIIGTAPRKSLFYSGFTGLMESQKFDFSTEIAVKFENPKEKCLLGYSILTHNKESNNRTEGGFTSILHH